MKVEGDDVDAAVRHGGGAADRVGGGGGGGRARPGKGCHGRDDSLRAVRGTHRLFPVLHTVWGDIEEKLADLQCPT